MLFAVGWFFFFKQKTAYEMRISDWSSDVCSSDLDVGCCPDVFHSFGRGNSDALSWSFSYGLSRDSQVKAARPARARRIAQRVSAMPRSAGRVTEGKSRGMTEGANRTTATPQNKIGREACKERE